MARIGLLVPSSNTSVETEFYRLLPPEVTVHTARLLLTHISPETLRSMLNDLDTQSRLLASADVDVIVLGAVAPALTQGLGYDRELARRIEGVAGKRATTTATALLEALRHLNVSRIALAGPYDASITALAKAFLEGNGIGVVATRELGLVDNTQVGRLTAADACDLGRAADRPDADAVVFAGTNMRTMEAVEQLERELGKPVVSTTAAALWSALRLVGHSGSIEGYGRLLREIARTK